MNLVEVGGFRKRVKFDGNTLQMEGPKGRVFLIDKKKNHNLKYTPFFYLL